MPFHTVALVAMGLWLIDNCNLLATACVERSRWDFLLTVNPLRLRNVTGSPVNEPHEALDAWVDNKTPMR